MEILPLPIDGAFIVTSRVHLDERGSFCKYIHQPTWDAARVGPFSWVEEYTSTSAQGVVRGMHCQLPPAAHAKFVTCVHGEVLDVLLDLRRSSACYGVAWCCSLTGLNGKALVIPPGVAHGFMACTSAAVMLYKTTSVHDARADSGVRWDSFGFKWPTNAPIVSHRDRCLPEFMAFLNPFA